MSHTSTVALRYSTVTGVTEFIFARSMQTNASTQRAHLHMASKGVVAVELAHVSIAGVFHLSVEQNVSGEQSHFSSHVHPVNDLSDVAVLWLP